MDIMQIYLYFIASVVCQWICVQAAANYYPATPPSVVVHDDTFRPDMILRVSGVVLAVADCTSRYSSVVNGTAPGPTLRFKEGDRAWIRVYNDHDNENTTIHWHGLTMRTSPFSDGTPMASQWPIPPHHYFDYEFQLQPGDAGTYFYHSHVGFQSITASGVLIVDEADGKKPPYDYDDELIILFSDVYFQNDSFMLNDLTSRPFTWSGDPDNVAVNGKSRSLNATQEQQGSGCEMAVLDVEPNKAYRVRFIGGTAFSQVYVAFEEHASLVLIEIDGKYVMPHVVDHLEVVPGQRYSAILFTKTLQELTGADGKIRDRFWVQLETRSPDNDTTAYAILHYKVNSNPVDTFTLPATKPLTVASETFTGGWLEDKIQMYYPDPGNPFPRLEEVTRRIIVNVQEIVTNGSMGIGAFFEQSGSPWFETITNTMEPYLVSLYRNNTANFPNYERALANGGFDPVTKTFPAKMGEVLEIVWYLIGNNFTGTVESHPWHMHGDHFYDCGTGNGTYDPVANEALLVARHGRITQRDTSNLYRPAPSDQQTLGPGAVYSWRAMRIRVQNPGVWMIHCHALQHMIMGMQTVWVFGDVNDVTPLPKDLVDGYFTFGGAAYGNASRAARVLHYWHD
ncbi:uncharacterized protein LOC129592127 [Paramacrobiotus metropolitanus]|uniref:uncharacterized protein LOC129592127 n=1 Tax=Paramacrobiotus metropolitanus TaxID=2943436 RepID=UPI002445BA34|nr:uncharacterized protein LOC129592127 [Paramacrobiotus metropolitanus]